MAREVPYQRRQLLQIPVGRPGQMDQLCYLRFVLLLQQAFSLVAYTGY